MTDRPVDREELRKRYSPQLPDTCPECHNCKGEKFTALEGGGVRCNYCMMEWRPENLGDPSVIALLDSLDAAEDRVKELEAACAAALAYAREQASAHYSPVYASETFEKARAVVAALESALSPSAGSRLLEEVERLRAENERLKGVAQAEVRTIRACLAAAQPEDKR